MDIWDREKRSKVMAGIRSKNTKPEITLRKVLFANGYRYRINYKKLPGKPDIVFPKYRTAIFVHGCFWHGHENCKIFHIPKSNTEFWKHKITTNIERDKNNEIKVLSMGWKVLTIWECEISKIAILQTRNRIIETLNQCFPISSATKIQFYEEVEDRIIKVAEDIIVYSER